MSIDFISALTSGIEADAKAAKDARLKRIEEMAPDSFAELMAQTQSAAQQVAGTGNGTPIATIGGKPGSGIIPAALIELADDPATITAAPLGDVGIAKDPTEAFLDFAQKTPAEQMRAMILAEMGLTEEDLKALDAKDRAAIEEKIRIAIETKVRQEIEKKAGLALNAASPGLLLS